MQNLIKTKTRLAYIQFIFSTFFSKGEIIDETEHFQNYFYKLSIPSTEKDQETVVDFNKNFLNKLSFSYFEFIKKKWVVVNLELNPSAVGGSTRALIYFSTTTPREHAREPRSAPGTCSRFRPSGR